MLNQQMPDRVRRVLPDLQQQAERSLHGGSKVYIRREEAFSITPENPYRNEIRFLGPQEAMESVSCVSPARGRVTGPRPPRRFYRPVDLLPHLPLFLIIDRATDQTQARVRGTPEYVEREASKLAASHGMQVADFRIVLEG